MTSAHPFRLLRFEQFESRLCPAATVGLGSNGDLTISGDTAGPIEITALDSDSYNVSENGALLATVNGVTRVSESNWVLPMMTSHSILRARQSTKTFLSILAVGTIPLP